MAWSFSYFFDSFKSPLPWMKNQVKSASDVKGFTCPAKSTELDCVKLKATYSAEQSKKAKQVLANAA